MKITLTLPDDCVPRGAYRSAIDLLFRDAISEYVAARCRPDVAAYVAVRYCAQSQDFRDQAECRVRANVAFMDALVNGGGIDVEWGT
jgi:hypothetical protein